MNGESSRKRRFKHAEQRGRERAALQILSDVFAEVEPQLHELQVPVAELAPEELVDGVRRFVEAIFSESA